MNYFIYLQNEEGLLRLVNDRRIDSSYIESDVSLYRFPYGIYIEDYTIIEWYHNEEYVEDAEGEEIDIDEFYAQFDSDFPPNVRVNNEYEILKSIITDSSA